ncbi:MAG: GldG family protein [Saccharofermentans sp.]|nr:GldG family protein [Saccharofermentans sp.]
MSTNERKPAKNVSKVSNNAAANKKKHRNERAHQLKIFAVGSVLILLAIVLLANVLIDKVLGNALTFDFSVRHSNAISDTSVKFLESLPQDTKIRIVGLFERPQSFYETKYQYIVPLLDDYAKKSGGKVSVEYVDVTKNPGIIQQLDPTDSYSLKSLSGWYVVSYNGKIDLIDPVSCYTIDTDILNETDSFVATGINTEYTFTNSMMSLVKGFTNKAYIVTGLKENGATQFKRLLNGMGIEVQDLAAATGFKVPEDCNLLVLNGPNSDITEAMYSEIKAYVERGGKVIISVDYSADNVNEAFPNLNRLLNEMNINIEHSMVSENDPAYQLNAKINDSQGDIVDKYSNFASEKKMHITLARPLSLISAQNANYIAEPVIVSSKSATKSVADENNMAKQIDSTPGILNVAMHTAYNVDNPGEVYVFGTVNFTSDDYFEQFTLSDRNADFVKSCVRSMLPTSAQYNIDIPVKKLDGNRLNDNKATTAAGTTVMIVFMIVLPVILSSMAVIVYNKRKNL